MREHDECTTELHNGSARQRGTQQKGTSGVRSRSAHVYLGHSRSARHKCTADEQGRGTQQKATAGVHMQSARRESTQGGRNRSARKKCTASVHGRGAQQECTWRVHSKRAQQETRWVRSAWMVSQRCLECRQCSQCMQRAGIAWLHEDVGQMPQRRNDVDNSRWN
jgi:hypothetical protein